MAVQPFQSLANKLRDSFVEINLKKLKELSPQISGPQSPASPPGDHACPTPKTLANQKLEEELRKSQKLEQ